MSGTLSSPALLRAAREGDESACEQVLRENAGLIWSIVRRYYGRGVDPDDLYQLACLGFLKAVRGYDPDFGTQFSTYAVPKIAGEIRRFLRDDGAVKVSRGIKERAGAIRTARSRLQSQLGREPTLSELSADTGLSPEDIAAAETATEPVASLQMETGDGLTLESLLGTGGMEEQVVEQVVLRQALGQLSEQEQQVLLLRYYRTLTQSRVARIIGVSQVQVSRIERRAIARLRELLEDG
ncbi:MAG: sigma-70 family RNA polymerase sigma factor [Oscillospiraceae bacterium]|nr:sigma-70 family RNA polymerase sigma factor [Oscillospiraceae bacterium]